MPTTPLYTRFKITRRHFILHPTPAQEAEFADYTCEATSANPISYTRMWEVQRKMDYGNSITILVQPVC